MSSMAILFGILPLLIFVIVDSFMGLKAGLVAAIVMAFGEAGLSYYWFGELDKVTAVSFILVVAMGAVSLKTKSQIYIKLQPVVLGVVLAGVLLVTYFMGDPILVALMHKYASKMPPDIVSRIQHPLFVRMIALVHVHAGIGYLLHAALVGYAAFKLSNWWWIAIRGVGFYIVMFLATFTAQIQIRALG